MQSGVSTLVPSIQAPTITPPTVQAPVIQGPAIQSQTIQPNESWLQYWPIAAIIVGALILLVGVYLLFLLWKARRKKAALETAERRAAGEAAQLEQNRRDADKRIAARLRHSFKEAMGTLKAGTSGRNYRYQVPWFLMVGENDAGKSTILDNAGLTMPLGKISGQTGVKNVCDWYFYADGLMLNVNGNAFLQSDGTPIGGRIWKQILRQLTKRRPERPIDGIVLTIPVTDLLSPLDESRERIRTKADAIYHRLVEAQRTLGLCFPVYVMITKCDQITGFKEFSSALPDRFGDQIFGWSSPYTLETAFNARWVDEAIEGMDSQIYETQSEIFAQGGYISGRDDLFLFPAEFQKIAEPLKEFMSGIFKQSVYHETIFLRGMYFTGGGAENIQPAEAPRPSMESVSEEDVLNAIEETSERAALNLQVRPYFVREVLEKKVFPEWQIARPASRIALHQNRTIRAIQIGLIVLVLGWGAGLWWSYNNLLEKSEILRPFLEALKATDADEVKFSKYNADGKVVTDTALLKQEFRLGRSAEDLHTNTEFNPLVINQFVQYANNPDAAEIWSVWNPASWPLFTGLHDKITESMRLKYREFILKVFNEKLKNIAGTITTTAELPTSESDASAEMRPEQMLEYEKLINYGWKLDELGRMINSYNALTTGGEGDLDKVTLLMEYLFNMQPSESFKNSTASYFTKAVNRASGDQINEKDYRNAATRRFEMLMDALTKRMIHQNPISRSLDEVQANMSKLVKFDPAIGEDAGAGGTYGGLVSKLNEAIERLRKNLDKSEYSWVFSDSTNKPMRSVFAIMKNSELINPEEVDRIERKYNDDFQNFKSGIITRREDYFDSPFLAKKDNRYTVSDEVINVKKALATLLSKDFMRTELTGGIGLSSEHILWDIDLLGDCSRLLNENFEFIDKTIPQLESINLNLKQSLANVARFQVELDIRKRLRDAQKSFPSQGSSEQTITAEIKHVNEAQGAISNLLRPLRQRGLSRAGGELSKSAVLQMNNLLKDAWRLLENSGRYNFTNGDLANWEGTQKLSQALFAVGDLEEFSDQLKDWRRDVTSLAVKDVQPMIQFLQSPAVSEGSRLIPEGRKFQLVAEQLEKYEKKIPGNSVSYIENFLLQILDSIKYNTNYEKYTKSARDISYEEDYFTRNLRDMKSRIRKRCDTLVEEKAYTHYNNARKFFNNRLAGHFPFVFDPAQNDTIADEARPDDIREFYNLYGQHLEFVKKWLLGSARNSYYEEDVEAARGFITRMLALQKIFKDYLQSEKPDAVPTFDVGFDYRVKFSDEKGSQDIVEWKIQSGADEVSNQDPSQRLRWEWGSPISVTLRWANNGDVVPVQPATPDGVLRVENRSAIFEFGNKWSLLQLMKNKEPRTVEEDRQDALAVNWPLKFDIDTKNLARKENDRPQARVYLRMRLYVPRAKDPIYVGGFTDFPYKKLTAPAPKQ